MNQPPPPTGPLPVAPLLGKRAKLVLGVLGVAAVGVLVWLFLREAQAERRLEQWDIYGDLRQRNESEELFFSGEEPLYQAARDRYVKELEAFVAKIAEEKPQDALEAQARWRIVRTEGESLVSLRDVLDVAKRLPHTERAIRHLEALQAKFPDFPLNWGQSFAPPGFGSTTKRLIFWFRENADWERKHLPQALAPDAGVDVVLRTERGDIRLRLYSEIGKQVTQRFLRNVQSGLYDGTCFVARVQSSTAGETVYDAVRAGDERSRGAVPYDVTAARRWAAPDDAEGSVGDETRHRVLHVRGVVSAWHPEGDPYDHASQLLFVVRDSPGLNYQYTPIGKLVDEASLATLDRIQASSTWRDDALVAQDPGEMREMIDCYRVPARIVKALVFKDGALWTGDVPALPTKAAVDASEQTLAGLKPDAYRQEPPAPPAPPEKPTEPAGAPPGPNEPK